MGLFILFIYFPHGTPEFHMLQLDECSSNSLSLGVCCHLLVVTQSAFEFISTFSPSHSLTFLTVTTVCLFVFQPSDFSVSLKAVGKNKHFKVQLSDGVYCIGQRRFNSMDELVEHYKKAPIFTSEHGEKLYLVKALL